MCIPMNLQRECIYISLAKEEDKKERKSSTQTRLPQKPSNMVISPGSIIVQVQTMARIRLHIGLKRLGTREGQLAQSRDRLRGAAGVRTVTAAERQILVTGDDQHGAGEGALLRGTVLGEELANSHGFLVLLGEDEDIAVEVWRVEEEDFVGIDVRANQVTGRVVRRGVTAALARCPVLRQRREQGVRLLEVRPRQEIRREARVQREPCQDDAVREVRVQSRQSISLARTERVTDVHDLGGLLRETGERTLTDYLG